MGIRIEVDEQGRTTIGSGPLRLRVPYEDEGDKRIMLEMQRRFDISKSSDPD